MAVQTTYSINPGTGYPGLIVRQDLVISKRIGSSEVLFGSAVCPHATDEDKVILPAANTDKVAGLVARSHFHAPDIEVNAAGTGLKEGALANILVKGAMLVTAEDAVAWQARGYVRCTAGGDAAEKVGGIVGAAEGSETIDTSSQIQHQASSVAGGLVLVEVDFTRKA
jgi:hypothetical protein